MKRHARHRLSTRDSYNAHTHTRSASQSMYPCNWRVYVYIVYVHCGRKWADAAVATSTKLRTVIVVAGVEIDRWRHPWDEPPTWLPWAVRRRRFSVEAICVRDARVLARTAYNLFAWICLDLFGLYHRDTEYVLRHQTGYTTIPTIFCFRNFMYAPDSNSILYIPLIYIYVCICIYIQPGRTDRLPNKSDKSHFACAHLHFGFLTRISIS